MSPSTAPPFCSLKWTARRVPLTRPQTVTSCAITLPSTCAPSPISRSEACTSPWIRPNTCAGPLHSMLPTIDMPLPMHEAVLACGSAFGLATLRSTAGGCGLTGACGCTGCEMMGAALAIASCLSNVLLSGRLRLNMFTPYSENAYPSFGRHGQTSPGDGGPFDRFVAATASLPQSARAQQRNRFHMAIMINLGVPSRGQCPAQQPRKLRLHGQRRHPSSPLEPRGKAAREVWDRTEEAFWNNAALVAA